MYLANGWHFLKPHFSNKFLADLKNVPAPVSTLIFLIRKILDYFINGKYVRRYTGLGTSTPDHVIRVKPFPLVITPKPNSTLDDFKKLAEKSFKDYRKYWWYFKRSVFKK